MIKIYLIYHAILEDTNIFTTDETKIQEIIQQQIRKYSFSNEKDCGWNWIKIVEETEFKGDLTFNSIKENCKY